MVKRILFNEIKEWLSEDKIIIIKGARRTGKTTLLSQIKDYPTDGGQRTIYISVDQESGNPIFSDPKYFIRYLKDQYGVDEQGKTPISSLMNFNMLRRQDFF